MSVNPSSISLKGFYLDPDSSSIGGTRNIYNNGVMCAKVFLGFSYNAKSGDNSTVQDIIDWISTNASVRVSAANNTDVGPLTDFGWPYYGISDPNNHAYVYDAEVEVPDSNERTDVQPGNALWHMAYYFCPEKDNLNEVSIYLSYTDETGKTASTINAVKTVLSCSEWPYSTEDFRLVWNKGSIPHAEIAEFNYVKSTSDEAFNNIHNILKWTLGDDGCFEVDPRTDKSLKNDKYYYQNENLAFCIDKNQKLFCVGSQQSGKNTYSATLLVDKSISKVNFSSGELVYDIYDEKVGYAGMFVEEIALLNMYNISADALNQFDGEALIMWQNGNFDFRNYTGQYIGDCHVYNHKYNAGRYMVYVKCIDSFGQKINVEIDFGGDEDLYPDSWAVGSVVKS